MVRKEPMAKTGEATETQYAALPFQVTAGGLQILLITSRETRRWVIPKGWPIRGLRPRGVAAREAFEEAGLVGKIVGKRSIGSYHYSKRLMDHREWLCRVKVFLKRFMGHGFDSQTNASLMTFLVSSSRRSM